MRKFLLAVVLLGSFMSLVSLMSGCGCGSGCGSCPTCTAVNPPDACGCPGLVDTPHERALRYALITDINCKEAVDDWDFFWLYDRQSDMSYWNPRVQP
jgi:hypothetical protein